MKTKLVLLGTGTPNACPNANGPSSAVVVGDRAYIVDFGPGVVRQASAAYCVKTRSFNSGILYTSAYRPHCRISRPHFYPVGIRASGSTQSIWP